MDDQPLARVNYFDRQFLRTGDFVAEQAYHPAQHRRHLISQHTWGIVSGLWVKEEDKKLIVEPGLAIDGYGRELVLLQGLTLNPQLFDEKGSDALEVWLTYSRVEAETAPAGYAECGTDPQAYRWQELGRVDLRPPSRQVVLETEAGLAERRQPPGVPEEDLQFNSARTPPDDPNRAWPIFLGRIQRSRTKPYTYTIRPEGRPYAGLVGEAIVHPAGRGELRLRSASQDSPPDAGSTQDQPQIDQGGERPEDPYRFALSLYDEVTERRVRRLSLNNQGDLSLRADTTIYGDLTVEGGTIEFGAGPAYAEAKPWRIYRVRGVRTREATSPGPGGSAPSPGNGGSTPPPRDPGLTELRIEMAATPQGGQPGLNQVVVGAWSEDEQRFVPCLTVDDQCVVTVHGNLVVEGRIDGEVEVERAARTIQDAQGPAQAFLTSVMLSGFTGIANALRVPLAVTPQFLMPGLTERGVQVAPAVAQPGVRAAGPPAPLPEQLRAVLDSDDAEPKVKAQAVVDSLSGHDDIKNELQKLLKPPPAPRSRKSTGSKKPTGGGNGS